MLLIYLSYCIGCLVGASSIIALTEHISCKSFVNNFVRFLMILLFFALSIIATKLLLKIGGF